LNFGGIFIKRLFWIVACATFLMILTGAGYDEYTEKSTIFPSGIWQVPARNNWDDPESRFSTHRMIETEHFAAFWEADFGECPSTAPGRLRFDIHAVLEEADRMWEFFHDELGFSVPGNTDRYRMHIYFFATTDWMAHGGGAGGRIGAMWLSPNTVQRMPFAVLAHEIGHAFQYVMRHGGNFAFRDNAPGSQGQAIWEITSQFMLWQTYERWLSFENWHLRYFLDTTHLGFLHEDQRYRAPFVLEYWAYLHGPDIVSRLWREVRQGEDIIMVYQRMMEMTQAEFNDEIFNASRRFITWDIDRIREVAHPYINQHPSAFDYLGRGWYQIIPSRAPQNYGYNGIRLDVPSAGTEISLEFRGVFDDLAFRNIRTENAGWRYGFVAMLRDGARIYSDIFYDHDHGEATFIVPEDTQFLWLVVMGAPTTHWEHLWTDNPATNEQWPYMIRLTNTELHRTVRVTQAIRYVDEPSNDEPADMYEEDASENFYEYTYTDDNENTSGIDWLLIAAIVSVSAGALALVIGAVVLKKKK